MPEARRRTVHAYVDESGDRNRGLYLLGAVLIDDTTAEAVRETMLALRIGHGKLHWHTEGDERRPKITEAVAGLGHLSVVVVGVGVGSKEERGRRKCLEVLLPTLESFGARRAVIESRRKRDRSDRDAVNACRQKRLISRGFAVEFGDPKAEPLLWLADVVCGAMLEDQRGDSQYADVLRDTVEVIEVDGS